MAGWTFDEIEQLIVETMDEVTGVRLQIITSIY